MTSQLAGYCAIAAMVTCTLGCSVEDRTLRERSADSGIESGEDGGRGIARDAGVGRPGSSGRDDAGGGRGGAMSGAGTMAGGAAGVPPSGDPTPPSCSDCAPAHVRGALVELPNAGRPASGVRLRAQGFVSDARVCSAVRGRVLCVRGGIGP
jgi:hypothetical protein